MATFFQRILRRLRSSKRENEEPKGYWEDDPFLSYIRGYRQTESAANDASQVYGEINHIRLTLLPFRSYYNEPDLFAIDCPNESVQSLLHEHFLDRYAPEHLYGQAYDLAAFFREICYMLLVYGRAFYQIVGEMREVESIGQVWLPTSFQCRPPSAMWVKRKRGRIVRFQQKYSPFVRFRDFESGRTFRPSKQTFAPEEILYFEYPFGTPSPVNEALKLIPKLLGFMYFSLAQSRGGAYPENHNFPVEKARFRTFREEKREYDIARAKVGKIFCCPVTELSDIRITEYYDVYQRVRFVERLQALRRYLVDEFNAQVLSPLAVRNGWSYEPSLKLQGFWEEAEIDAFYNEFLVGKVERAEFLKELYRKCIDGLGEAGSSE